MEWHPVAMHPLDLLPDFVYELRGEGGTIDATCP